MAPAQKTFTIIMWVLVVVGLVGVLAMQQWQTHARPQSTNAVGVSLDPTRSAEAHANPRTIPDDPNRPPIDLAIAAPTFTLFDQHGRSFDSSALRGRVWTAMLFFSNCPGVCPMMADRIETLQSQLTDERIHFVSFSVDPERDTVERLAEYARSTNASDRWHMLTGPDDQVKRIAAELLMPYDNPMNHSSRILLIDQTGQVRRTYLSGVDSHMAQLARDARQLAEQGHQTRLP